MKANRKGRGSALNHLFIQVRVISLPAEMRSTKEGPRVADKEAEASPRDCQDQHKPEALRPFVKEGAWIRDPDHTDSRRKENVQNTHVILPREV